MLVTHLDEDKTAYSNKAWKYELSKEWIILSLIYNINESICWKFAKPSKFQKSIYGQEGPLSLSYPPLPPLPKMGWGGGKPRARREHQVKWDLKGPHVNRVHERPKVTQDTLLVRCYLYSFLTYQDHPSTTVIITKYRVLNRCQKWYVIVCSFFLLWSCMLLIAPSGYSYPFVFAILRKISSASSTLPLAESQRGDSGISLEKSQCVVVSKKRSNVRHARGCQF